MEAFDQSHHLAFGSGIGRCSCFDCFLVEHGTLCFGLNVERLKRGKFVPKPLCLSLCLLASSRLLLYSLICSLLVGCRCLLNLLNLLLQLQELIVSLGLLLSLFGSLFLTLLLKEHVKLGRLYFCLLQVSL